MGLYKNKSREGMHLPPPPPPPPSSSTSLSLSLASAAARAARVWRAAPGPNPGPDRSSSPSSSSSNTISVTLFLDASSCVTVEGRGGKGDWTSPLSSLPPLALSPRSLPSLSPLSLPHLLGVLQALGHLPLVQVLHVAVHVSHAPQRLVLPAGGAIR